MPQPPRAHREQDAGSYKRAPRHQRRWGLLVEDEFKTDGATLVQNAYRGLVATLFYLAASVTHDVVIHGRENISGYHPCIYVSNHKRDFDSVIVASTTYGSRGILQPNTRLIYAIREDVMWPGFLEYLQLRGPFRRLLSGVTVRAPVAFLKGYPIGYVRRRDDLPRIQRQLQRLSALLDAGRDLYWTPEGGLSLDGRFGRFRAGFHRIIRESHAPLRVVPTAVFYDFMTTMRTRCFIRIGPEMAIDRSASRQDLERQARTAVLRQMTVNIGHLAAAVMREMAPNVEFTRKKLIHLLVLHARRLRATGVAIDARLLSRSGFERRLDQFLGYARRQGILGQAPDGWAVALGMDHEQMQYVYNELLELENIQP